MKMVKSLLLGTATGLVAVVGAQAADLPVKAKPVEYVRICSLYGEGFFYIPGTDTCLKIGGWVRYDGYFNQSSSDAPPLAGAAGLNTRSSTPDFSTRARTVVSFDARSQTEYGTLRAYYRGGFELTSGPNQAYANGTYYFERAFLQLGGWTFGKSQSFFDVFYNQWAISGAAYGAAGSNTAAFGVTLAAYTAQFGNGVSATLSVEDNNYRRNAIWDATSNGALAGAFPSGNALPIGAYPGPTGPSPTGYSTCGTSGIQNDNTIANSSTTANINLVGCAWGDYAQQQFPDIVGNLRVDQAWGSAQVSGALHQLRANWYGNNFRADDPDYTGVAPADRWGWAVNGGIMFNLPWNPGDKFWVEATYEQGASSYIGFGYLNGTNGPWQRFNGSNLAAAWALDAVFANNVATPFSGLQLSSAWDVTAALEHYWTPALRTSVWGSYTAFTPGSGGNLVMCSSPQSPVRTVAGAAPTGAAPLAGCDFGFNVWTVGTRTIWNPVRNLDVGVEVMYMQLNTNQDPNLIRYAFGGSGTRPGPLLYTPSNEGTWVGMFRLQRNFYP
jgi:Porin subfamily